MATSVSRSYSAASGTGIHAGRYPGGRLSGAVSLGDAAPGGGLSSAASLLGGNVTLTDAAPAGVLVGQYVPSWITGATVGRWGIVPSSNRLSDLDPRYRADLNPLTPAIAPWGGTTSQRAVTDAYSGMATDFVSSRIFAWGGGHSDYGGNEPYLLNLLTETPQWQMLRPPSGSTPVPVTDVANINTPEIVAASATGVFSDGRPRPTHTYGSLTYVPGKGMVVTNLLYCYPHVNGPQKAYYYDESANDWVFLADYTSLGSATQYGVSCCYDNTRNCIWYLSTGTQTVLKFDIASGVVTRVGAAGGYVDTHFNMAYDEASDLVFMVSSGFWSIGLQRVTVFDPATGNIHVPPAATGSGPAGYPGVWMGDGATWDKVSRRWLVWNESLSDRTQIATIAAPAGNPRSAAWTVGAMTIDGGNSITPTTPVPNQTHNRFRYLPELGICVLLNRVSDDVYFFKVR